MSAVIRRAVLSLEILALPFYAACSDSTTPLPPLTVTSITPANAATGISIHDSIRVVFSSPLDVSTVTGASVSLSGGAAVPGALTVEGNTLKFKPTNALTEFRTPYSVNITTAVRSTAGAAMNATYASNFTTVMFDTAYYYRFINAQMGATKALGTFAQTFECFFPDVGQTSGQLWYPRQIAGSNYFLLRNLFQGDSRALEGAATGQSCLITNRPPTGNFTGQAWEITPSGSGYRLTNQNLGAGFSLDVVVIANTQRPGMAVSSASNGQVWNFTRGVRRSTVAPPPL